MLSGAEHTVTGQGEQQGSRPVPCHNSVGQRNQAGWVEAGAAPTSGFVSSPRRLKRSVRSSRTPPTCMLHLKIHATYRAVTAFRDAVPPCTWRSMWSPNIAR